MGLFDAYGYKGKRAVVVGAATGMGAAAAELLLDAGAEVVAMDRADVTLGSVKFIRVDMSDKASIEAATDECGGPVDALFSCAGVADGTPGIERINFIAKELSNVHNPGVRAIIDRLAAAPAGTLTPTQLVDRCLDLMGLLAVDNKTRAALIEFAEVEGDLHLSDHQPGDAAEQRVGTMLRMIASTREFQLA